MSSSLQVWKLRYLTQCFQDFIISVDLANASRYDFIIIK